MRSHPDWTTPKKRVPGQVKVPSIMPAANRQEVRWSVMAGGSLFLQAELKWKLPTIWIHYEISLDLPWFGGWQWQNRSWVFLMWHFEPPSVKASTENRPRWLLRMYYWGIHVQHFWNAIWLSHEEFKRIIIFWPCNSNLRNLPNQRGRGEAREKGLILGGKREKEKWREGSWYTQVFVCVSAGMVWTSADGQQAPSSFPP